MLFRKIKSFLLWLKFKRAVRLSVKQVREMIKYDKYFNNHPRCTFSYKEELKKHGL